MAAITSAKPILGYASRPVRGVKPVLAIHALPARRNLSACVAKPVTVKHIAPSTMTRARTVDVKAQASSASAPEVAPFKWGANMKNLGICVAIATAIWFSPAPSGVSAQAWHLLAVFVGTIAGIITTPLPLGAVAILGLGTAMLTKVLTFAQVGY